MWLWCECLRLMSFKFNARFEVFTVVTMENTVFVDVTGCSLVEITSDAEEDTLPLGTMETVDISRSASKFLSDHNVGHPKPQYSLNLT